MDQGTASRTRPWLAVGQEITALLARIDAGAFAAVDGEDDAGDVRRGRGGKPRNGGGDLLRSAQACERGIGADLLLDVVALRGDATGVDGPGSHGVHPDAVGAQQLRQAL